MKRLKEYLKFLGSFALKPHRTGSVVPSSRALASALVSPLDPKHLRPVIEVGPGTGAVTRTILEVIGDPGKYLGIELNAAFLPSLEANFPGARFVRDSAENLGAHFDLALHPEGYDVVSCIPWTLLPRAGQQKVLAEIVRALAGKGVLTTFVYVHARFLPGWRQFERLLRADFPKVEAGSVVWANFPPAVVYRCGY